MLNRLFIVIGVLAILVIVTAFLAPFFVDWSSYRARLETIGSEALGTDVQISGDIDVMLLPQPRVRLDTVIVGPAAEPLVEIASVEATFSLMDFMRDRYAITRLVLSGPQLNLLVDEAGRFVAPIHLPETVSASNVSVADADIENGTIRLSDARTLETWEATGFDGKLQMAGLRGPFSLNGTGTFRDMRYDARFNTSAMNAEDAMQLAAFVRPADGGASFSLEGILKTRDQLAFSGEAVFRQSPPDSANAGDVRGDLVFTSAVEAGTEQILFSDYTVIPDENRPATRLTGAASVQLGEGREFDAVISGGVVALSPRDALEEDAAGPYEFVRLIEELPTPILLPLPGRIGIDVSELDLRAFALRELRVDARTDGTRWSIGTLSARMPGNTQLSLVGELWAKDGKPAFDGAMTLDSARLDTLALQWRKAAESNPLFNMPGSLAGRVSLADGRLALADGRFVLDGVPNKVSVEIATGETRRLSLSAQLGALDDLRSLALQALVPDVTGEPGFGATFPEGDFEISADAVTLSDLPATGVDSKAAWRSGALVFDRLAAEDIGGARVDVSGALEGSLAAPVISGKGQVSLAFSARTGAVATLLAAMRAPEELQEALGAIVVPAELAVELSRPDDFKAQELKVRGRMGVAELDASMNMTEGLFQALQTPVVADLKLNSGQPAALSEQLGLGPVALVPEDGPIVVTLSAEGTPSNSLEVDLTVEGSGDRSRFFGNVIVTDPSKLRGKGKIEFAISDVAPIVEILGAEGVGYDSAVGSADLSFTGAEILSVSNIDLEAGGAFVSGELSRTVQGADILVSGSLRASAIEVGALAGLIGGPSSMVSQAEIWPDGPFAVAYGGRNSRGRVHVETPFIRSGGRDIAADAGFDLAWDDTNLRIRGLEAGLGGGKLGLDAGICCFGGLAERQLSGRATLSGVDVDAVLPDAPARVLDGNVEGGATFSGTGDSFAAMFAALTGEGSFAITNLAIEQFDPSAFTRVAEIENILELAPEELTAIVEDALKEGPFKSQKVGGVFSIAGGAVRVANLAAEGEVARLFGGTTLSLSDLGLDGSWTLTPTAITDGDGVVSAITAQVTALLSGTLLAPEFDLDLGPMIDAIKVRAYEIEVDRLEKLRAEEEARARAAAEERARLMEEQARQRALEELARAEEEAARLELEAETQRALQELADQLGASQDPLVSPETNGEAPDAAIDLFTDPLQLPLPTYENGTSGF